LDLDAVFVKFMQIGQLIKRERIISQKISVNPAANFANSSIRRDTFPTCPTITYLPLFIVETSTILGSSI